MNKKLIFWLICIGLVGLNVKISEGLDVGTGNDVGVVMEVPTAPINYSIIETVNSSDFWDDLDTPANILLSDLTASNINITGYTLTTNFLKGVVGTLDMRGDPWYLSGTSFQVAGSILGYLDNFTKQLLENRSADVTFTGDNLNLLHPTNPRFIVTDTTGRSVYLKATNSVGAIGTLGSTSHLLFEINQVEKMRLNTTAFEVGVDAIIEGNLDVEGNTTINQGLIVNEDGNSNDVRMESRSNTHQFFLDGSNNCIGFDTSTCQGEGVSFGHIFNYIRRVAGQGFYIVQAEASGNSMFIAGVGNTEISIDGNNNENDREFIVSKDSLFAGAGTVLFNINEGGNANLPLGNFTSENVHLPALIYVHTDTNITSLGSGYWHNVTFYQEEATPKRRITHTYNDDTNDTFIIVDDGFYNLDYYLSFSDIAPNPTGNIAVRVIKNGVEVEGSLREIDSSRQNADILIGHGNILMELVTGDELVVQFATDDTTITMSSHATFGDHKDTAIVTIERVA